MEKQFQLSMNLVVNGSIRDLGYLYGMIEELVEEFDICDLVDVGGRIIETGEVLEHDVDLLETVSAIPNLPSPSTPGVVR